LVDLGFIEETRHGSSLSGKTRLASEWRLTAFKCDLTGALKTCLFMQRGAQARDTRQSRSRRPAQTRSTTGSNESHDWLKRDTRPAQTRYHSRPFWGSDRLKRGTTYNIPYPWRSRCRVRRRRNSCPAQPGDAPPRRADARWPAPPPRPLCGSSEARLVQAYRARAVWR
jgi:hypothetical protein